MTTGRGVQLAAAALAVGAAALIGRVVSNTWLGLLAFVVVLLVGYVATAPTRRGNG
jgi:hypothetical protein